MWARLGWKTLAGVLVAFVGVGGAMAATLSPAGGGTVKAAVSGKYGRLLVTAGGMTLYHYVPDKKGAIKCVGACAKLWPPLVVGGNAKPRAGAGVSAAKLSTARRADGTTQVTFAGLTLYRYSADTKPGDVRGQGVQGRWFAVTSTGALAKAKAGGTPATTTTGGGYQRYGP